MRALRGRCGGERLLALEIGESFRDACFGYIYARIVGRGRRQFAHRGNSSERIRCLAGIRLHGRQSQPVLKRGGKEIEERAVNFDGLGGVVQRFAITPLNRKSFFARERAGKIVSLLRGGAGCVIG